MADDQSALEKILAEYNDVLAEDPANIVCRSPLDCLESLTFMLNLPALASIEASYYASLLSLPDR